MTTRLDVERLAQQFAPAGVQAIALMGSYARGDAGPFSDIDLVRFTEETVAAPPGSGSHLIGGSLVVVSDVRPSEVDAWFWRPEVAVNTIAGLRGARPLIDRDGTFAALQDRACAFVWDDAMQARANAYASQQMVGWIEEVHKGLEGLRRGDIGRLLNARFGLSWGLSRVVQVQRGVLLAGDNAFFQEVEAAIGVRSEWARLWRAAFGLESSATPPPPLQEQVVAGLRLYVATARLLAEALEPADASLVEQTVALVMATLRIEH